MGGNVGRRWLLVAGAMALSCGRGETTTRQHRDEPAATGGATAAVPSEAGVEDNVGGTTSGGGAGLRDASTWVAGGQRADDASAGNEVRTACERLLLERLSAPCADTLAICDVCAALLLECSRAPTCMAFVECNHERYREWTLLGSFAAGNECPPVEPEEYGAFRDLEECYWANGPHRRCDALRPQYCADSCETSADCGQNVIGGDCIEGPGGDATCALRCNPGKCPAEMICESSDAGDLCRYPGTVHRPGGADSDCCLGDGAPCRSYIGPPCCSGLRCMNDQCSPVPLVPTDAGGCTALLERVVTEREVGRTCVADADCVVEYDPLCGTTVDSTTFGCFDVRGAGNNDEQRSTAEAELKDACGQPVDCDCAPLPTAACVGGACEIAP